MKLLSENQLKKAHQDDILPFFDTSLTRGVHTMPDGVDIVHYSIVHPQPRGAIVISSGRTEAARKYAELIFDFYQNGYSVFIHDHRGQGESSRLSLNLHHGHVDKFEHYVDDFNTLIDEVIEPWVRCQHIDNKQVSLLSHSMGGAIAMLLLIRLPNYFGKAIFCSPMFGIATPVPFWIASILLNICLFISKVVGKRASYFVGGSNYQASPFDKNKLMHSEIRYKLFIDTYANYPQLQVGSVTSQWIDTALKAIENIEQYAHKMATPCLVLQSGDDTIVSNEAIERISTKLPCAEFQRIGGAYHELLFETDEIRIKVMNTIFNFIENENSD